MVILCIFFKVPTEYSQTETEVEKENSPYRNQFMSPPSPEYEAQEVGPSHHGTARPQFMDGRTASNMEGSCRYIE